MKTTKQKTDKKMALATAERERSGIINPKNKKKLN
jgi:hypothetical protein